MRQLFQSLEKFISSGACERGKNWLPVTLLITYVNASNKIVAGEKTLLREYFSKCFIM